MKSIKAGDKISLAECKRILKQNDLTDEQIIAVRDWLYFIGEIMIEETETKNIKGYETESNSLYPCVNRRTK